MEVEKKTIDGERTVRVTFGNWNANGYFAALAAIVVFCFILKSAADNLKSPLTFHAVIIFCAASVAELFLVGGLVLSLFGHTTIFFKRSGGSRFVGIGTFGVTRGFSLPACGVVDKDYVIRSRGRSQVTIFRVIVRVPYDKEVPRVIYSSDDEERIDSLLRVTKEAVAFIFDKTDVPERTATAAAKASVASRDRALLARPPEGISATRDSRKRTVVAYRKRSWIPLVALVALLSGLAAALYGKMPLTLTVLLICGLVAVVLFCLAVFSLFGKRTMTIEYGEGETFAGIGGLGVKKKFRCPPESNIEIVDSGLWFGGTPMDALCVSSPKESPAKLCTTWPNRVKPFLAAVLRSATQSGSQA